MLILQVNTDPYGSTLLKFSWNKWEKENRGTRNNLSRKQRNLK
jgi:hypothetical protein